MRLVDLFFHIVETNTTLKSSSNPIKMNFNKCSESG